MILATCSYILGPSLAILRKRGLPFSNRYRPKRGAWNPLAPAGRGRVSGVERVLAFIEMFEQGQWRTDSVFKWTGATRIKEPFIDANLLEMVDDLRVEPGDLAQILTPEAIE